jgi:hypothetical protein
LSKPGYRETYPTSAPHFVLDDAPDVVTHYGPQPTVLNIIFPFDTIEENMPSAHKLYNASSLACQGDGQQITYALNPQTGRPVVRDGVALVDFGHTAAGGGDTISFVVGEFVPCPGYAHNLYAKCNFCRPQTALRFFISEIPRFSVYEVVTGSIHNYTRLDEQLSYFAAPITEGGMGVSLKGIPFRLSLAPHQISVPNVDRNGKPKVGRDGKPQARQRVEKHLLGLEIDPVYMARLNQVHRRLAEPERMLGLPAPEETEAEEYEDQVYNDPDEVIVLDAPVEDPSPAPTEEPPPLPPEESRPATRETLAPTKLKNYLERKVAENEEMKDKETGDHLPVILHPFGKQTAQIVSAKFQEALRANDNLPDKPETMYHVSLNWLTGCVSANDLTAVWADALLDWLTNSQKGEKFKAPIAQPAGAEARLVYEEALRDLEQKEGNDG